MSDREGVDELIATARHSRNSSLDLSRRGLTSIPEEIRQLTGLAKLDLSGNQLTGLPEWIGELSKLTMLDLRNNQLRSLPESASRLCALTMLDLSGNKLTRLPGWIGQLTGLKVLDLHNNQFSALPESVGHLSLLIKCELYNNKLMKLPRSIGWLTRLTELNLYDNHLTALPESIGHLVELTRLDLSGNRLTELPESIGRLTELTELTLRSNRLTALPESIGRLTKLIELTLHDNRLSALPESIGDLTGLAELSLQNNRLALLPESIGKLALTKLTLHNNLLTALPESIGALADLTKLFLSNNRLTELPESIGQLFVTELALNDNQLTALPASIGELVEITELTLASNRLTALPPSLGELTSITRIDLSHNFLSSLPESVGQLTALNELYLSDNHLTALPDSISQLSSLTTLSLRDNRLTAVPESIGQLTRLTKLVLGGNLLMDPPSAVLSQGTEAVLTFLRARRAGSQRQWTSKLLIVGEGAVGKTTLLKVLSGAAADPLEQTTHGLNIRYLDQAHPSEPATTMHLAAWDFGGQHIYHATHQFFLTDQSLFLLVWNARAGWEQAKGRYWLDIIKARTAGEGRPAAPVILVATHSHHRAPDLPLTELRSDYPNILASVQVDSLATVDNGIDDLRAVIAEHAASLPLMGSFWPAAWIAAQRVIHDSDRNRMGIEPFNDLLAACGVADATDQATVTEMLHQLGEILHYAEDPELSGTVVLKPAWLSERIAAILDCDAVSARNGLLLAEDITREWPDVGSELQKQLLFMMDRYNVSYRIADSDDNVRAIVVDRLPWEPPEYQAEWNSALGVTGHRELKLHYVMAGTVPPGIPGWFIAHAHRFATTGFRPWRTGILLAHPDRRHLGLLRFDQRTGTVELAVRGPRPAGFLGLLDLDFVQATLRRYPGLSVTRTVPFACTQDCSTRFRFDMLTRFQDNGQPNVQCLQSGHLIAIAELIDGIAVARTAADQPAEIAETMARIETAIIQTNALVRRNGELLRDDAEIRHLEFARLMSWIKVSTPTVFTVTEKPLHVPGTHRYVLRLYCAEPNAIHQLPDDEGCYPLTVLDKWAGTLARHLTSVAGLLSGVTGLSGTVLGRAAPDLLRGGVEDLKKVHELLDRLKTVSTTLDDWFTTEDVAELNAQLEADARMIEELLRSVDPRRHWGGLSKTLTPGGLALYLCRDHARAYRAPSPRPRGL